MIDSFLQDLTYALRGLRARPAFTTAIILTLALGIGANAAMFSLVDRMLFRPPPLMKDPASAHRVYGFETYRGKERVSFGGQYARYVDLTKWTKSFERTAGFAERDLAVGIGDAAREMRIGIVSASFFSFFDAPPALGRYFLESEDTPPEGARVAVASYARWQTEYGGRKDILGTKVQIGPDLYEIIGVLHTDHCLRRNDGPWWVPQEGRELVDHVPLGLDADDGSHQGRCERHAGECRPHPSLHSESRRRARDVAAEPTNADAASSRANRLHSE
jgi:hypothetical protein